MNSGLARDFERWHCRAKAVLAIIEGEFRTDSKVYTGISLVIR